MLPEDARRRGIRCKVVIKVGRMVVTCGGNLSVGEDLKNSRGQVKVQ